MLLFFRPLLFHFILIFTVVAIGCDELSQCEKELDFEEHKCGIDYDNPADICENPFWECQINCLSGMRCEERLAYYFEDAELSLDKQRCYITCREGFACDGQPASPYVRRCDGFIDCLDKTDEQNCTYHTCDDGQRVVEYALCDGYVHCADGSDEIECEVQP
ncbi:MAG: LDL receptor domain-containing protein [Deltaproteobacteria bacterium]|nr:LDL receptor domain-containing protein [Deltaproteobacteria bacterium]